MERVPQEERGLSPHAPGTALLGWVANTGNGLGQEAKMVMGVETR